MRSRVYITKECTWYWLMLGLARIVWVADPTINEVLQQLDTRFHWILLGVLVALRLFGCHKNIGIEGNNNAECFLLRLARMIYRGRLSVMPLHYSRHQSWARILNAYFRHALSFAELTADFQFFKRQSQHQKHERSKQSKVWGFLWLCSRDSAKSEKILNFESNGI